VVAGLVQDYLPARGNFDAWAADPAQGGKLNLASLDLVQKRNHILETALDALPDSSRQLLSTLALLSEAADYTTLSALNPHQPPEPNEVPEPVPPENHFRWERWSKKERAQEKRAYTAALHRRQEYERAHQARRESQDHADTQRELQMTVRDLERRGLLQYDAHAGDVGTFTLWSAASLLAVCAPMSESGLANASSTTSPTNLTIRMSTPRRSTTSALACNWSAPCCRWAAHAKLLTRTGAT
jgi:hypothetical protein